VRTKFRLCNISQGLAFCMQCRVSVQSTLRRLKLTIIYFARIALLKNWTESTSGFITIIFMQLHFLEACSLAVYIFYRTKHCHLLCTRKVIQEYYKEFHRKFKLLNFSMVKV